MHTFAIIGAVPLRANSANLAPNSKPASRSPKAKFSPWPPDLRYRSSEELVLRDELPGQVDEYFQSGSEFAYLVADRHAMGADLG